MVVVVIIIHFESECVNVLLFSVKKNIVVYKFISLIHVCSWILLISNSNSNNNSDKLNPCHVLSGKQLTVVGRLDMTHRMRVRRTRTAVTKQK